MGSYVPVKEMSVNDISGFFTQLLKLRFTATIIPSFHFISAVHI